ncbi:MAG: hypothetical protein ACREJ2_05140, partial [Planctomycetota bacterium]
VVPPGGATAAPQPGGTPTPASGQAAAGTGTGAGVGAGVSASASAKAADDESHAKALLASADEVYDKAPNAAEQLYRNILDFYPDTAAAAMARLKLSDLNEADDRACQVELDTIYQRGVARATYTGYWAAAGDLSDLKKIAATRWPDAAALQTKLANALQGKLDTVAEDLKAQGPLIFSSCLNGADLTKAAAVVKTLAGFTDPATQATALALEQQLAAAQQNEDFAQRAPALKAVYAAGPYLQNFDQRLRQWNFLGAQEMIAAADRAGVWTTIGPQTEKDVVAAAAYLAGDFKTDLVRKLKQLADAKVTCQVTVRVGGVGVPGTAGSISHLETVEGTIQPWVNADGFMLQAPDGMEHRVNFRMAQALSLLALVRSQPPADAAAAAVDDQLAGALTAVGLANGEVRAADLSVDTAPWQRLFEVRLKLESEAEGEALVKALKTATGAQEVLPAMYALKTYDDFRLRYPAPLIFLSPDGRAAIADAEALVQQDHGGELVWFETGRHPDATFKGLKLVQLNQRKDADTPEGQLVVGASGGTRRVLIRFDGVKVPPGMAVKHAFLRLKGLSMDSSLATGPNQPPAKLDQLLVLKPLDTEFNPSFVTWEFANTAEDRRWSASGAYPDDTTVPFVGREGDLSAAGGTPDDIVFDITPYFAKLAVNDYTALGNGLVLKVGHDEPDYRITLPVDAGGKGGRGGVRLELQLVPTLP